MLLTIFSVYDSKVSAFMPPFFMRNKGEAIRAFVQIATSGDNNIVKYPADFTLFQLGTFDDLTCKFVLNSTPLSIGTALDLKCSNDNQPVLPSAVQAVYDGNVDR